MLAARWRQIESVFNAAHGKSAEERTRFLDEACSGDQTLRHEVESLLANEDLAASFLETAGSGALPAPAAREIVPPGERIGPYTMIGLVGAGGMGEVYKAHDERLDRHVAIKFLPRVVAEDAAALQRFEREARAASALNHPNICTVYDVGEHHGRPFLVMELLEGESLKDRIAGKRVPIPELVAVTRQVCAALQAAHAKDIVHRDVKPGNIFVTHSGQVKILDFGLAKRGVETLRSSMAAPRPVESPSTPALTVTGTVMGTLAYMSPEQAVGEEVDARTDIFSFGVVLYEMATGQPPFRGKTPAGIMGSILTETPLKPSASNKAIPVKLERVILRALEKDRELRYGAIERLSADVEKWQQIETTAGGERTRRWMLAAAGTVAASLAGGAFLMRLPVFTQRRKTLVAVLPLTDSDPDPKQSYFASGLHGGLIAILGRLYPDGLRVIGQTSMNRYKGTNKPLGQIASELKADYVVRGEIRREGDRINITAHLIRAKDQAQIWTDSFDRDLRQVRAAQVEIAQAVAQGIERSLRPNSAVAMAMARPLDPKAYEAYLRRDFDKAIELDPDYAPAYLALANNMYLGALFGFSPPKVFTQVIALASKAIELDPTLAGAHATMALGKLHAQFKWREAEDGFRRATKLDPGNSGVRHGFAHFLLWANRGQESAEECNIAQQLDPFDADLMACRGWHDLWAGDYDQAIESARRALSFGDNGLASLVMGWTYEQKGMFTEGISALQKAFPSTPRTASVAHVLARSGKRDAAEDLLAQLLEDAKKKYVSAYDFGVVYTGLGETRRALEWFDKAYEEHSGFLVYAYLDPRLQPLRSEPPFQDLLHRMGLPHRRA